MDRVDARFVVNALDSRISRDRESLDLLAASASDLLKATAARVRALAADWPPAIIAAHELESIAELGGGTLEQPRAVGQLVIFVDKLRSLTDAPPQPRRLPNRRERRVVASAWN